MLLLYFSACCSIFYRGGNVLCGKSYQQRSTGSVCPEEIRFIMMPSDEKDIRLLSEVLPNVAIQLRSAMANICGAANRIATPEAREQDPVLDKTAAVLTMSCQQMLRLVGNLSAASELSQNSHFRLSNDDVIGFCEGLCGRAEALFELRGVTLTFSADRQSQIIAMNAAMLERALLNLLSNTLKFTPAGGTVSVRIKTGERAVQIAVSDTGSGIEPEQLEHIFERYLETDSFQPLPHGLGLGLPLCQRVARGHGGRILAQSAPGKGTVFTMSLPNTRAMESELNDVRFDYAGGFDHVLMELSDALPREAFMQKNLD